MYDMYKDETRKLRGHILNFACDEPQWKKLSHMAAHGAVNCSDYRSCAGEKHRSRYIVRNGEDAGQESDKFTVCYPPTVALNATIRTKNEVTSCLL